MITLPFFAFCCCYLSYNDDGGDAGSRVELQFLLLLLRCTGGGGPMGGRGDTLGFFLFYFIGWPVDLRNPESHLRYPKLMLCDVTRVGGRGWGGGLHSVKESG